MDETIKNLKDENINNQTENVQTTPLGFDLNIISVMRGSPDIIIG